MRAGGILRTVATLAALPAALAGLAGWQARAARRAEYLPDPAYRVRHRAGPGGDALRLAVLGDSTAAGIGAPTVRTTLPALVAERLAERLERAVEVTGHAVSGARTADIAGQAARLAADRPDAVLVVVGSNDVTHLTPVWAMRARTADMLEQVRQAAAGAPVVLGGIPEFATVPALSQPLRALAGAYAVLLRARQRSGAQDASACFVDIAAQASPRFLGRPESMSRDGFHPSEVGYGLWADALAPAVAEVIVSGGQADAAPP